MTRIGAPHWCVSPKMTKATFPPPSAASICPRRPARRSSTARREEARQAIINSKAMAWLLKREFDAMTELRFDDEGARMAA